VRVGVPREIKDHEYRVAITPAGVQELVRHGHDVLIERDAGVGSAISNAEYAAAGARIIDSADEVWGAADLVLKVKEPVPEEYHRLRPGQVLFAYLHLAASRDCTEALLKHGVTAIAYETVQLPDGSLPLLAPMSEIAGRLAPQVGATALQRSNGGRGVLLGGVPGVGPAKVMVLGAGVSGMNAAQVAAGMGAEVTLLDIDIAKLRRADAVFQGRVRTLASTAYEIERTALESDLIIGAVLIPGAKAPTLISSDLVAQMKPGTVLVDIAVDQGGCFADSRPTTHSDPTYPVHNTVFYCVSNMPGAVPTTATQALTKDTLRYALALANKGWRDALADDRRSPQASTRSRENSPTRPWPKPTGWRRAPSPKSWPRDSPCPAAPSFRHPAVPLVVGPVEQIPSMVQDSGQTPGRDPVCGRRQVSVTHGADDPYPCGGRGNPTRPTGVDAAPAAAVPRRVRPLRAAHPGPGAGRHRGERLGRDSARRPRPVGCPGGRVRPRSRGAPLAASH